MHIALLNKNLHHLQNDLIILLYEDDIVDTLFEFLYLFVLLIFVLLLILYLLLL